eukprot:TRINITY_DN115_c0_g3_i1.p1 TRINITY_DN115_c0_g3~~TRINITY_DN115_c0_g3_i1.p1  ORF type:complete len:103 (+),score=17.53 TRINITY_DN115_c0_g3_i1:36-311(+)
MKTICVLFVVLCVVFVTAERVATSLDDVKSSCSDVTVFDWESAIEASSEGDHVFVTYPESRSTYLNAGTTLAEVQYLIDGTGCTLVGIATK